MRIDAPLPNALGEVPQAAKALETMGFDAVMTSEVAHDPFLPLLLAAEHSERLELMTAIAVAFARSPTNLAHLGHDLNAFSKGRFILGLGSQIKPHITKRFSMPWSSPAARMKELIQAMRAIWDNWYHGKPLDFRGEFFTHTLMTPNFTPTNTESGPPRVFLAAVGPLMTQVAAEVADGLLVHGFTTERYLREVTLPAVEEGLRKANRPRSSFEVTYPAFLVSGHDEESSQKVRERVKQQVAFYGSTPAYRGVLELHGWGDLQGELNAMSKRGLWKEMADLISDDILETFAVVAEPQKVAAELRRRFSDIVDRLTLTVPVTTLGDGASLVAALKG